MPKRFTDTEKWKKPFIRGLEGPYKLLWMYILDDCDHAGVWQVDFEVAAIRIGESVTKDKAIKIFGDRVEVFSGGAKWFVKDFIEFQYGELSEANRLHRSVISILKKNNLGPYKGLTSPQGQGQGIRQGQEQGQGGGEADFKDYEQWTDDAISGKDWMFTDKIRNMDIPVSINLKELANSHLALLAQYPKKKPADQNKFRISLAAHIVEKLKEQNGKRTATHKRLNGEQLQQADTFGDFSGGGTN